MKWLIAAVLSLTIGFAVKSVADEKKSSKYKKTQEVNFDEADIDGVVHSPDGAYLLQKRGVKFSPLYKMDQKMEKGVLDSINYLK
jgi:hypothetical protein